MISQHEVLMNKIKEFGAKVYPMEIDFSHDGFEEFLAVHDQEVIAAFLERTGQYLTNDASREAAISEGIAASCKAAPVSSKEAIFDEGEEFKTWAKKVGREGSYDAWAAWRFRAILAQNSTNVEGAYLALDGPWENLFRRIALQFGMVPSSCVNDNEHIIRKAGIAAGALAAPAAAQGQLDGTARIRCRKCGEDVTVEWNCAHIKSPPPSCCGQTPCAHPGTGPCNRPAAIKKAVAEAALETDETGLTVKEAWWAGAREGLGLPADTPRAIVGQRLRALAATPAPEAAPTTALMRISDLLSSMFSGARAHVRGEDEEVVGYTVRNGALHKIVGILASYKPVIIPANLPKAHETITGLLCGTSEAAPSAKEGEADEFPARILDLLKDVADRDPPEGFGVYEDGNGEPLQDDADAALAWIASHSALKGLTPAGGDR